MSYRYYLAYVILIVGYSSIILSMDNISQFNQPSLEELAQRLFKKPNDQLIEEISKLDLATLITLKEHILNNPKKREITYIKNYDLSLIKTFREVAREIGINESPNLFDTIPTFMDISQITDSSDLNLPSLFHNFKLINKKLTITNLLNTNLIKELEIGESSNYNVIDKNSHVIIFDCVKKNQITYFNELANVVLNISTENPIKRFDTSVTGRYLILETDSYLIFDLGSLIVTEKLIAKLIENVNQQNWYAKQIHCLAKFICKS